MDTKTKVNIIRIVGILLVVISIIGFLQVTSTGSLIVEGYQASLSSVMGFPMSVLSPEQKISKTLKDKLSRAYPEQKQCT